MSTNTYPHVSLKAPLRRKLKLCWLLLNDRPIMYRVGVTHANIYLPESVYVESTHITDCLVRFVNDSGEVGGQLTQMIPDYSSPIP